MCVSSLLTHGLVLGGYGGGVVEDENVPFKLPACHGRLAGGQHHHAFPYLVPPHLKKHSINGHVYYTKHQACVYKRNTEQLQSCNHLAPRQSSIVAGVREDVKIMQDAFELPLLQD